MAARDLAAVFLDRDGTLIEDAGYPRDPTLVRFLPGAAQALRGLAARGLRLVVVSNQSGIGRGLVTPEEASAVAGRFEELLRCEGVALLASYYCPHAPREGCSCRKPAPGMLLRAASELGIDLGRSFLVGDRASDVEAGARAGCSTVLLAPPPGAAHVFPPDFEARDWAEALAWIVRRLAGPRPPA